MYIISLSEMAFVGDKKKNMECAKHAGVKAILMNRTDERKEYGQDFEKKFKRVSDDSEIKSNLYISL